MRRKCQEWLKRCSVPFEGVECCSGCHNSRDLYPVYDEDGNEFMVCCHVKDLTEGIVPPAEVGTKEVIDMNLASIEAKVLDQVVDEMLRRKINKLNLMYGANASTQQPNQKGEPAMTTPKGTAEKKELPVVEILRVGEKMILPVQLTYGQIIDILLLRQQYEETVVAVEEVFPVFPWDGALATHRALVEIYGLSMTQEVYTFFGKIPPVEKTIDIGFGVKTTVPWGKIMWPLQEKGNMTEEHLHSGVGEIRGQTCFKLQGQIKRKWLDEWRKICDRIGAICKAQSIYRGQPVRISFTNEEGERIPLPEPEFMDLSSVNLEDIVYSRGTQDIIDTYVLTLLKNTAACRAAMIPMKRGVLAAGEYGTGKSLLALAVGKVGTANGWTFIYTKNAKELPLAIRFAKQYQPAVIFAEDLDRATSGEERTDEIDEILNTLDGIDSKGDEIMVVLTTNDLKSISPAMRRPGRLDVVVHVKAPDAEAASRLVRVYGRGLIAENADLTEVGKLLEGATPAVIRETVERAKLATIMRTGNPRATVIAEDLEIAAHAMKEQQDLLAVRPDTEVDPGTRFIEAVADEVHDTLYNGAMGRDTRRVRQGLKAIGVSR